VTGKITVDDASALSDNIDLAEWAVAFVST